MSSEDFSNDEMKNIKKYLYPEYISRTKPRGNFNFKRKGRTLEQRINEWKNKTLQKISNAKHDEKYKNSYSKKINRYQAKSNLKKFLSEKKIIHLLIEKLGILDKKILTKESNSSNEKSEEISNVLQKLRIPQSKNKSTIINLQKKLFNSLKEIRLIDIIDIDTKKNYKVPNNYVALNNQDSLNITLKGILLNLLDYVDSKPVNLYKPIDKQRLQNKKKQIKSILNKLKSVKIVFNENNFNRWFNNPSNNEELNQLIKLYKEKVKEVKKVEDKLEAIRSKMNTANNVNSINELLKNLSNINPKYEDSIKLKKNIITSLTKKRNEITKPSEEEEVEEDEEVVEEETPNLNSNLANLSTNINRTQKLNKIKKALEYLNSLKSLNENKKGKINQIVGILQDMGLMHENENDVIVPPNSNKNLIQKIKTKINSLKSKLESNLEGGKKPTTKKPVKKAPVKKPTTKKQVKKPVKKSKKPTKK